MLLLLVPPLFGVNLFSEILGTPVFWLAEQILRLTGNGSFGLRQHCFKIHRFFGAAHDPPQCQPSA